MPALTTVAVAEQTGLIGEIGGWVLQRACADRQRCLLQHPEHPLTMSVNVFARQLTTPGLHNSVAAALDASGMDPAGLVLEVTEGILIEDGDRAWYVLNGLKTLGVRLALDDFGIGYCSLSYLRRFPIDIVKIDQSFIANILHDPTRPDPTRPDRERDHRGRHQSRPPTRHQRRRWGRRN